MEKRKQIPNYPNYSITKSGRVWSNHYKRWFIPYRTKKGYMRVTLTTNKPHTCKIHRLVLEAYVGLRPQGMECRHLNGNPADNRLENLCWGTPKENIYDTVRHNTHARFWAGIGGEKHPASKLCENQVKVIFHAYHDGIHTQQELADAFCVDRATIGYIVRGKTWRSLWN